MTVAAMTQRWRRHYYRGVWGNAHLIPPTPARRELADWEIVRAYTNSLSPAEAAAFLAGLGWGKDFGHSWVASTVRRLLPARLERFEQQAAG